MADSGMKFDLDFSDNKISAELDENYELSYFEAKNKWLHTRFARKRAKKYIVRSKFYTTGINQLSTVDPYPLDREELIEKEYSRKPITQQTWFAVLITVLAIVFDFNCYLLMFNSTDIHANSDITVLLIAAAAALAIDVLPAFFARILHSITSRQKLVMGIYFVLSLAYIMVFIVTCFLTRCGFFATVLEGTNIDASIFVHTLIPIGTTLVCFIVNYLSTDPYENKIKVLCKVRLYRQENINELHALLEEIKSDNSFEERIMKEDDDLYKSAEASIDAIAKHYRALVRTALMVMQGSPADTSDLSINDI